MAESTKNIDIESEGLPKKAYVSYPHPRPYVEEYKPINTWNSTKSAFYYSSVIGLLTAATRNSISKDKIGPLSIITRSGKLWATIVLTATGYKFASCSLANLREKKDTLNEFYSGAIAGGLASIFYKNMIKSVGFSFVGGCIAATVFWSGTMVGNAQKSSHTLRGKGPDNHFKARASSDVERQGFWDVARRRPLSQTLEELGEGVFKS
ncbi:CYFA0S24e00518g1_1 [Cyberlindnera fabianii]|uniref:CYFA0S24e00518g1_1 n=1 Tax=Cyberlindnera fabianii TaxID=36022 RepID=A0A061BB81_CYBFA|nr:CYFA0S24e00518g1_1 [Cyberlindnera fabianii]